MKEKMKQVLVSILVPVYKVPEVYLRKCVESLMGQTLREIEIILVDDGSPDQCGIICDEYAATDSRIKVVHKENGGLAAARNTAFDAAIGETITFVDGDDYLSDNACERGYNVLINTQVELVFWNHIVEYNNSVKKNHAFDDRPIKFDKDGCKMLQSRVLDYNGCVSQTFSKLIRRDYLIKYNIRHIDELRQGAEGFVFNIALFENLDTAYYLPEVLYYYRYNNQSISHSHNEGNYYLIIKCFEYIKSYISKSNNKDELENNLHTRLLYVVVTTGITGYFNPENKQKYKDKVQRYKKFLHEPIIEASLEYGQCNKLPRLHRIVLKMISLRLFRGIALVGKVRSIQLHIK